MRIEHIAMYVNDLETARDFLLSILMRSLIVGIIMRLPIFILIF